MTRFYFAFLAVFAPALWPTMTVAEESRPLNVVFLLADDLGWTGLKCFGSDLYETPNLDRLAARSMKFTAAYSACTVCSPTRASIMTGIYPAKLRLTDFIAGQNRPFAKMRIPDWTKRLDAEYVTLAEALQGAGYATAHVGKWHLSPGGPQAAKFGPQNQGFDVSITRPRRARGYFLPEGFNAEGESKSNYLTDYLTDRALDFIDKNKQKAFFLYFAYHTPHTPIQGRPDYVARYRAKVDAKAVHKNPTYAAMVKSLDDSVGRVLRRLEKHKLSDRTLVVFTSDNGGLTQRYGKHDGFTENLPLRRGKGSAYEGGVRVPTIIHWPGVTKPASICREPIMSIDFYPTILEITASRHDKAHRAKLDGRSITRLLRDSKQTLDRNLYWHYPHYHAGGDGPYTAMRSGYWRLIEFHEDHELALYDLRADPGERDNLAKRRPERVQQMRAELQQWRRLVKAQMPSKNPDYDPRRATQVRGPRPGRKETRK